MKNGEFSAYLAPEGLVDPLCAELRNVRAVHGRLILADGPVQAARWAQNVWLDCRIIPIRSIGDAAHALRAIQRNWAGYTFDWHRRAALIQAKLPYVSARPLNFGQPVPPAPMGSWTLLAPDLLLAAPRCTSAFVNGEVRFVECKDGPPNRAYLKLWEALTLVGAMPGPGSRCLDAGASPGGWTWVLQQLGAAVLAVDRSELDPSLMNRPHVMFRRGNAFSVRPETDGPFDWIFCDVACYPEKLFDWVSVWLDSGRCANMVCTLKFQGTAHYDAIEPFAALPHTAFGHLFHNKHELTWMRLDACGRSAHAP